MSATFEDIETVRHHIATVALIDHHVHSCLSQAPSEQRMEQLICESGGFLGAGQSRFDSQAGFALARHCSPLRFETRCAPLDYYRLRSTLPEQKIDRKMLTAAGVSDWIIDPGWGGTELLDFDAFAERSAGSVHRLVRLESVAEPLLHDGLSGADFIAVFRSTLAQIVPGSVGFKTICAYRCGFGIDWSPQPESAVMNAVNALDGAGRSRLTDPVITNFIVHEAMNYHLPIQLHVGLGDRDVDIRHSNPLDLRALLTEAEQRQIPIALLHCWPYERECGYLCQNYTNIYMDVGLTMYLTGVQAADALRRALELCPFTRMLYSSDAWGLPELHYLGAAVFREALNTLLSQWIQSGEWLAHDALRVIDLIAQQNAIRLYNLSQKL
jgi:predicted TIM-barrel fold metal-dependent hydrolase